MPKRFTSRSRIEVNRKQRKARWIHVKNLMRLYADCSYNGDFYCDHVYDPKYPWTWVDFRFFHTKLKRYFAVAMVTAEYEAYSDIEQQAFDEAKYPDFDLFGFIDNYERTNKSTIVPVDSIREAQGSEYQAARARKDEILKQLCKIPRTITPRFEVKNYGPVAVGIFATVNKSYIDEHVIREFIAFFRSLGEPTTPGFRWEDKEVEVVIPKRYING